ncbi:hypothetical protein HBH69_142120 [Parastagonospora nodorum]|nr:hypothetical protein HBI06_132380 [Parastagonospora nodorum]KAH4233740.1 hypothetical protein HBI05_162350 [Parastagonospora nodorum]KAH4603867.1 hypothetical protein HBH82_142500 [Parastagonospora nodorum]KAH4701203.1 hypothetical protein HBH78_062790 [Parastagonospora nodorum]KAH4703247.1 hypothetical protein HBH67_116470 [Parastagonospora nodorum]
MTPSAQDVSPEVNPKWLELRQKHQNESNTFQAMVNRNREEFEARVDRQRKDLLALHSKEESEFWSKNTQTGAVRAGTKAKFARTQTPRGSVAPSKKIAPPASRPATPRMSVQPPVTPARPTQHPRYADVPPAPKRPTQRAGLNRNSGQPEVIDLCSDDDDDPNVTKKQPIVQKKTAQKPAAKPSNARNATIEDAMAIDGGQVQSSDPFSIPEATLELFGGSSSKAFSTPVRTTIKNEFSSPNLASPFAKMDMSTPKTSDPEPASPSPHRASTATRQFGSPRMFGSRAPSCVPGPDHSTAGFMNRVASAMPNAPLGSSPFYSNAATDRPSVGVTGRLASVAPRASSPVQKWPSPRLLSPASESKSLPWANLGTRNQQQRERSVVLRDDSVRQSSHNSDVPGSHYDGAVGKTNVEMHDAPMSEATKISTSSSSDLAHQSSHFERGDSNNIDPFTTTGVEAHSPQKQTGQLPSPPPSQASVVSEPVARRQHNGSTPSSSFKMPSLPASAAPSTVYQPIAAGTRHVRSGTTDSRVSSYTLPASPCGQRGASVLSRASLTSRRTGATQSRKRPMVISMSSDEDSDSQSDYAPSENASPIDGEPPKPTKHAHTAKKTKTNDGAEVPIKAKPRVQKVMGRKGYGFKFAPTLGKTVAKSSKSAVRRPATEPRRTNAPKTVKKTPVPEFARRRAAVAAKGRIQNIFDSDEEFETELAIEEADHIESARLPDDMRRMSLTPSPPDEDSVDALAEPGSFKEWSQLRSTGDRKARLQGIVEDDDSEVDIGE